MELTCTYSISIHNLVITPGCDITPGCCDIALVL